MEDVEVEEEEGKEKAHKREGEWQEGQELQSNPYLIATF